MYVSILDYLEVKRCSLCDASFTNEFSLCPACRSISPDILEMLVAMKKQGGFFSTKDIFKKVLSKTQWWLDVCSLDPLLAALVNSGRLIQDGEGRYSVP